MIRGARTFSPKIFCRSYGVEGPSREAQAGDGAPAVAAAKAVCGAASRPGERAADRPLVRTAVEVIGSALVAPSKGEQFLPDIWEVALPSNATEFARDLSVMIAIRQKGTFVHRLANPRTKTEETGDAIECSEDHKNFTVKPRATGYQGSAPTREDEPGGV